MCTYLFAQCLEFLTNIRFVSSASCLTSSLKTFIRHKHDTTSRLRTFLITVHTLDFLFCVYIFIFISFFVFILMYWSPP